MELWLNNVDMQLLQLYWDHKTPYIILLIQDFSNEFGDVPTIYKMFTIIYMLIINFQN